MTLPRRDLTVMPADTAAVGQQVLAPSNPYRVIGERVAELVDEADYATLYEAHGRYAHSPALLALVTLFQFREDLPDWAAAAQVVVRLDWKYALHLPLGYTGFDFSCLSYFRSRPVAHGAERLVFDTLLQKIEALGLLKKRHKQRTDSVAVLGAVRDLSALETVYETLRLAVRALREGAADWGARTLPASFVEQYAHRCPDYWLSVPERAALQRQVGQDGYWLLDQLAQAPAALAQLPASQTLAQRYRRSDGQVTVATDVVDCTERILTPHDVGVRAGEKQGKKWVGEKVHVTETANSEDPNFLTDVSTANASGGDAEELPRIRAHLAERGLQPAEQYVDSSYISGQQLAQSQAAGIELVGHRWKIPRPTGSRSPPSLWTALRGWRCAPRASGHASGPSAPSAMAAGR
jgi:transposase